MRFDRARRPSPEAVQAAMEARDTRSMLVEYDADHRHWERLEQLRRRREVLCRESEGA